MKRVVCSLIFAILLASVAAPAIRAQGAGREAAGERLRRVMDPSTDVEEFRRELDSFYAEMQDSLGVLLESEFARTVVAGSGLDPIGQLAEARKNLPALTAQDLGILRAAFAKSPSWRETPQRLAALLNPDIREGLRSMRTKERGPSFSILSAVNPSAVTSIPGGIIPDNCNDAKLSNGNPRVSNSDISIAQTFVIAGEGVMESLPTDVLTFEGHAIAAAVLAGLKGAALVLETFKGISDDCSDTDFQNYVTANLNEQVSTRSSQTSVTALQSSVNGVQSGVTSLQSNVATLQSNVANLQSSVNAQLSSVASQQATTNSIVGKIEERLDVKASSRATQDSVNQLQQSVNLVTTKLDAGIAKVLAGVATLQDQALRLQIEANLCKGANEPPIGSFMLPETQGGFLGLTRVILLEIIQKIEATGQSTRNAQTYLTQGDQLKASGRYKEAYESYSRAYRVATGN